MNYYEEIKKNVREELLELFKKGGKWEDELDNVGGNATDIIWATEELVKKEGFISEAIRIAEYYKFYTDTNDKELEERFDGEMRVGKEVNNIATVRGVLCWLLQAVVVKLEVAYYSDVINLLEGKDTDTPDQKKLRLATGDNLYVKEQATIPLEILIANSRAKRNADGSPFDFGEENRIRVEILAFRMLKENKDYKRVLEKLAGIFSRMRYLDEKQSYYVLETFFYDKSNPEKKQLNPPYITQNITALAVHLAEFRSDYDPSFNNASFVSLLKRVIEEGTPEFKRGTIWLLWKTCEEKPEYFKKIEKYIPLILKPPFSPQIISQLDFLLESIIKVYPNESISLFESILTYMEEGFGDQRAIDVGWGIFYSEKILPGILNIAPEKISGYLGRLYRLWEKGLYIGNPKDIVLIYKNAPEKYQEEIKKVCETIEAGMMARNPLMFS